MGRVFTAITSLVLMGWLSASAAADGPLKVHVGLSPMGSFDISTDRIIGSGEKKGANYTAKEVKVLVKGLKTGMSLRDKHLHDKLQEEKFKYITVTDIKATAGKGTAKITIRDVTKDISFTFKDDNAGKATAEFPLSLKDFKFSGINYQGVGVEDEVKVSITVPYVAAK